MSQPCCIHALLCVPRPTTLVLVTAVISSVCCCFSWWRHQMETFSALLTICAGNSPVPGEFPTQRPVTRSFDVYFDLRPNKRLSKQSWGWWFEMPSRPLWRHRNVLMPFLAVTGKLWGVFRELYEEKWPRYIDSALYRASNGASDSSTWHHHLLGISIYSATGALGSSFIVLVVVWHQSVTHII